MAPSPPARRGDVVAVVPVNALDRAKGRLAHALDPSRRAALVGQLLAGVLSACAASSTVARVLVVAGDGAAAELAAALAGGLRVPLDVVVQDRAGLTAALELADAATADAAATLVVAADLPLVAGHDLDAVCAACPGPRGVVVAPTLDGGTGALLRRPARAVPTAYGPGSAAAHLALARAAGLAAVSVDLPGLRLDVDTPASLEAAARAGWEPTSLR